MRIISKFHDFYDVGQRSMMDTNVIYLREMTELRNDDVPTCCFSCKLDIPKQPGESYSGEVLFETIGFCGDIIPVVRVQYPSKDVEGGWEYKYSYTMDQLPEHAEPLKRNIQKWFKENTFVRSVDYPFMPKIINFIRLKDLFLHFRVPIFHVKYDFYGSVFVLNPSLKDADFARYKDPITTFQEVFRFMSNDLANVQEVDTNISDKDMAASKGFGHKYAFKTEPGTKTRKGKVK